jgi:hypothetical protein
MESVESLNQRLEAIKRGIANSLATVAVGRGRLAAARTVRAHVRARITLTELEQRAAYILHIGNKAAGIILTQLQERRSNIEGVPGDDVGKGLPSGGRSFYYVDEAAFEGVSDTADAIEQGLPRL